METIFAIIDWLRLFATSLMSLFVIVNPIGNAALLPNLIGHEFDAESRRIVFRASICAFFLMLAFAIGGPYILKFFRVSLSAFRIAGGILLFIISIQMVQVRRPRSKHTEEELESAMEKEDISMVPLATPMLVGPGTMTTALVLAGEASNFFQLTAVISSIFILSVIVWIILRVAPRVVESFGPTGINLLTRLMGLMLSVRAVQFIIDGLTQSFPFLVTRG